jgi:TRAP-type C4-dicarboxylate transport system permease small subunit
VSANAIEFTGIAAGARGLMMFVCLSGAAFGLWGGNDILTNTLQNGIHRFADCVALLVLACFIYFGFYMGIKGILHPRQLVWC